MYLATLFDVTDSGSESVIRLVDIDGDGRQDIIFGAAKSADLNRISNIDEQGSLVKYCKSIGKPRRIYIQKARLEIKVDNRHCSVFQTASYLSFIT